MKSRTQPALPKQTNPKQTPNKNNMDFLLSGQAAPVYSVSDVVAPGRFAFNCKDLKADAVNAVLLSPLYMGRVYYSQEPGQEKPVQVRSLERWPSLYHPWLAPFETVPSQKPFGVCLVYDIDRKMVRLFEADRLSMCTKIVAAIEKAGVKNNGIGAKFAFSSTGEGKATEYFALIATKSQSLVTPEDQELCKSLYLSMGSVDLNRFFNYQDVSEFSPLGEPNPHWETPRYPKLMSPALINLVREHSPAIHDEALLNFLYGLARECQFRTESVDVKVAGLGAGLSSANVMDVIGPMVLMFARKTLGISPEMLDDVSIMCLIDTTDFNQANAITSFTVAINAVVNDGAGSGGLLLNAAPNRSDEKGYADVPF